MKYIVAVSGGVDSVVLLDMLVKSGEHDLIVAHFDHGMRRDSAADARFVAGLSKRYGLPYKTTRGGLGAQASEELAREKRYAFLRKVAEQAGARIVTAHHGDDVIETIAINLTRGTGWRGLAVLNDPTIERPLLQMRKRDLYDYALSNGLEWVEDETNSTDAYLRNRLRRKLGSMSDVTKNRLQRLRGEQCALASQVDRECAGQGAVSRYFLTMVDEACAVELLRWILAQDSVSLTRPQRLRLLHAVKTAAAGSTFEAGGGIKVDFTKRDFIVKHPL